MISAMPAVALRRERGRGPINGNEAQQGGKGKPSPSTTPATGASGVAEYYHNKISRVSSFPPTRRTYSTSTSLHSPDLESQPLPGEVPRPYGGRFSCFGHITLFHLGCAFLAAGLIMLFVSVGSIKGDVMPIRATGSSLVVFGALLCLIRTVFFQRQETLQMMSLRTSDSFVSRPSRSPTSPLNPAPTQVLPTHAEEEDDDDDAILCPLESGKTQNGDVLVSPDSNAGDNEPTATQQEKEGLLSKNVVV